jgi:hypothetical protein
VSWLDASRAVDVRGQDTILEGLVAGLAPVECLFGSHISCPFKAQLGEERNETMAIDDWMTEDDEVRSNVILLWPGMGLDYGVCWINLGGYFSCSECAMIFLDTQGLVWIDYYC